MADYDSITDFYRIAGVRNMGSGYSFSKTRIVKKKKRRPEEETQQDGKGLLGSAEGKREGIDIEA